MSNQFKQYLKAIGKGQRAGTTLSQSESYEAFKLLLQGQCTSEQRGAFLMLLRVREETPEELAGFLMAAREFTHTEIAGLNADIDLGCYAGKRRHLPWFLLSAMVLSQQGYKVFLHDTHEPDSKRMYVSDALLQLGLALPQTAAEATLQMQRWNISYLNLATINPALEKLIQLRRDFGLRSCANSLARMLNPSNGKLSIQGVFHKDLDQKHAQVAQLLDDPNSLCFRGEGGEVEVNPERAFKLHQITGSIHRTIDVPSLLEHWTIKPKTLSVTELKDAWAGKKHTPYSESAILGTLTTAIIGIKQVGWSEAFQMATQWWQKRHDRDCWLNHIHNQNHKFERNITCALN